MPSYPALRDFASTYNARSHEHSYDLVEEYERVMRVASKYPNKGSGALSSMLNLPRGRIRPWVDGEGKPDAVRGLETARDNGWLEVDILSETFESLNILIAGVFSGGSIGDFYVPAFAPDEQEVAIDGVRDALSKLGAGSKTRHDENSGRATEVLPATDASVLGRVLVSLGAPYGDKAQNEELSLPSYLEDAPAYLRQDFVQVYLWNRGQPVGGGGTVQIMEQRQEHYFEELGTLFEDVADAPVYVKPDGIRLSSEAARQLRFGRGTRI